MIGGWIGTHVLEYITPWVCIFLFSLSEASYPLTVPAIVLTYIRCLIKMCTDAGARICGFVTLVVTVVVVIIGVIWYVM